MRFGENIQNVSLEQVNSGSIVAFFTNGSLSMGMKIFTENNGKRFDGIVFLSANDQYAFGTIFFLTNEITPWDYDSFLEFRDATLYPDFSNIVSGAGNAPSVGELATLNGKIFLCGAVANRTRHINLENGEVIASSGSRPMILSRWKITATTNEGSRVIVNFPIN